MPPYDGKKQRCKAPHTYLLVKKSAPNPLHKEVAHTKKGGVHPTKTPHHPQIDAQNEEKKKDVLPTHILLPGRYFKTKD